MTDREYLEAQAPLRAKWLDQTATPEEREVARVALMALVAKATKERPPLTGTFTYSQEDVDEKKHGY
jgi:hypothetical protein